MESMPQYVSTVFIITTLLTLWLLHKATKSILFTSFVIGWMIFQYVITRSGFYENTLSIPPHPFLLIVPPFLVILLFFLTERGRNFIDSFDVKWLTYLHTVRIPVEIVLFWLSIYKLVPPLITLEGRNFDIFSGVSAPIIAYLGYQQNKLGRIVLIGWNFICLALLLNVVINGILSMPTVFQIQAFDQPNIGLFYFPFIYLPCFIVPAVFLAHLVCLRKLFVIKF